jgi:hypothetical protein
MFALKLNLSNMITYLDKYINTYDIKMISLHYIYLRMKKPMPPGTGSPLWATSIAPRVVSSLLCRLAPWCRPWTRSASTAGMALHLYPLD